MKFFENQDFYYSGNFKVQVVPFLDSHIIFVRNIYKNPEKVSEYLHSLGTIKSHKNCFESKNGVDFLDGQHILFVGDDPHRHELEAKIANFFKTQPAPRNHLVFNQFFMLKPPPKERCWWPHTDKKVNILTFLNQSHDGGPGTAIYRKVGEIDKSQQEHINPWRSPAEFEEIYCMFDRFNSFVAFPGHWYHGMSITDDFFTKTPRFTEICFL